MSLNTCSVLKKKDPLFSLHFNTSYSYTIQSTFHHSVTTSSIVGSSSALFVYNMK